VTELPDGFLGALVPEANPAPLPWDAFLLETGVSDASAAVLPDAMLDGLREHSDAGAEKLADPALDVPAQVALERLPEVLAPRPAAVLCKLDAAPSAA
jgi:hypothetical protein